MAKSGKRITKFFTIDFFHYLDDNKPLIAFAIYTKVEFYTLADKSGQSKNYSFDLI